MIPGLESVTVTPGRTPPESSVTMPPIAPTPCWAATGSGRQVCPARPPAPPVDNCLRQEFAVNREPLHALAAAVGDIHAPVIRHLDTVHDAELRRPGVLGVQLLGGNTRQILPSSTPLSGGTGLTPLSGLAGGRVVGRDVAERAPHPLVSACVRIEHDDALVAVPVGDKKLVGLLIHEDIRRPPHVLRVLVRLLL